MTSREERLEENVDRLLTELERDSTREVTVTEDGSTTRLELRAVGWTRWIIAGPFLLLASWILVAAVLSLFESATALQPAAAGSLRTLVIGASLAVIGVLSAFHRESIVISQRDLCISSGVWRLRVTRRVPLDAIRDVRVEAFRLANWDRYVVALTEHRRHRFAWSVSASGAQEIARWIRRALPRPSVTNEPVRPR